MANEEHLRILRDGVDRTSTPHQPIEDDAESTRSSLHHSAASLAIECGDFQSAECLIVTALTGNPPAEIAEELKDLFVQINLRQYAERRGVDLNQLPSGLRIL